MDSPTMGYRIIMDFASPAFGKLMKSSVVIASFKMVSFTKMTGVVLAQLLKRGTFLRIKLDDR